MRLKGHLVSGNFGCVAEQPRPAFAWSKQRLVDEFNYAAQSWPDGWRVITRLEWGEQGHNPRFEVTNLDGPAQTLYDQTYCQRGEAENRIKEAQVGLFATRTSCHVFASNQLRVLLTVCFGPGVRVTEHGIRIIDPEGTEYLALFVHCQVEMALRLPRQIAKGLPLIG